MKHPSQRGQILPLIAAMLGVLMGFGGIAVDVGYLKYQQQSQQNATDAAALGGAQQLVRSSCVNASAAQTGALIDAATNGFPNGGSVAVTPNSPPSSGHFAGNACAIAVNITTHHVSTYFSRLFGYPGGMTVTTQATAVVSANSASCIYILSPTVSTNINGANIQAPGCAIAINDTANFNGATVKAPFIGYAGKAPNENGATFPLASPAPMLPVADPCPEIPGCAYLTANPPSTSDCQSFNGNGWSGQLRAGCYSNLNLNGAHATMNGLYVLTGSTNFNGATMTGSNVTFYVASGANAPNFNGVSNATLAPPSSGNYTGVLYYQVPTNSNSPNFNGVGVNLSGLLYCPAATSVNFNGAKGNYLVLVFGAVNYNGSATWDFATPAPGQSISKQAVLAE
jgi:Putative Flp pilus-assembly TadE/G-like